MSNQQEITRVNRQTKTRITVVSAEAASLDDGDGATRWYTICEDHSETCGHPTRKLATWFAASPTDWCEGCRNLMAVPMCTSCEESPATHEHYDEHNGPFRLCDECEEQTNALPLCGYCGTFGHESTDCDERELTDWSDAR